MRIPRWENKDGRLQAIDVDGSVVYWEIPESPEKASFFNSLPLIGLTYIRTSTDGAKSKEAERN